MNILKSYLDSLLTKAAPLIKNDKLYLKYKFYLMMGYFPDLKNPKTYSEKMQWLKLHDRQSIYTQMVDKLAVKQLVREKLGEGYTIPVLGVWDRAEDIEWDKLPQRFVLKCNHDSGEGTIFCKDKSTLNKEDAIERINRSLQSDYYIHSREWPYKNVQRKVFAEEYMEDKNDSIHEHLQDYKFLCFSGEPKLVYVTSGKFTKNRISTDFFDLDFNHLDIHDKDENSDTPIVKPSTFEEMKRMAKVLSKGISHVRVDFFEVNGKVYFGEYTFYNWGGFSQMRPKKWNSILGDWIKLPCKGGNKVK